MKQIKNAAIGTMTNISKHKSLDLANDFRLMLELFLKAHISRTIMFIIGIIDKISIKKKDQVPIGLKRFTWSCNIWFLSSISFFSLSTKSWRLTWSHDFSLVSGWSWSQGIGSCFGSITWLPHIWQSSVSFGKGCPQLVQNII